MGFGGRRLALLLFGAAALAVLGPRVGDADTPARGQSAEEASLLCSEAVALAERAEAIPRHLLAAVARAESGRPVAADRVAGPWPWTVTARGTGLFFPNKEEAMQAAAEALAAGEDNVDVGCLQINLRYHPDAFVSLEEAFDPLANAAYGAAYLRALFLETGSWPEAVGRYHSATPFRNTRYREKVLDLWNQGRPGAGARQPQAGAAEASRSGRALADRPRAAGTPRLDQDVLGELKIRLEDLAPRP